MFRSIRCFLNILPLVLIEASFGYAQTNEQITLTTYYPSPQGSYVELRSRRLALGDNYLSPIAFCWPPAACANVIDGNADLVVEGTVGIGTINPGLAKVNILGRLQVDMGAVMGRQGFGIGSGGYDMEDFWYDGGSDSTYFFRHIAAAGVNSRLIFVTGVPGAAVTPIMGVYNNGNVIISPNALITNPTERLYVEGNIEMNRINPPYDTKIIGRYLDLMNSEGAESPGLQLKGTASCMWVSSANGAAPPENLIQICDSTNILAPRQVRIFGDLQVDGNVGKGGGIFLIDHPLEPKNKILKHSFVESPDMKNIYDGIAVLDDKGEAVVQLPEYFDALNSGFRYQLTPIGAYAPVYIKQEVKDNKFIIAGGSRDLKVSWMLTGSRKDAYALKHPIVVEEEKGVNNIFKKGEYVHPEAFGEN